MAGLIQTPANPAEGPDQIDTEDEGIDENNPAFQTAMKYAMEVLYKKGAAKDVSAQLKAAPNVVDGMADVAYEITTVVDDRTNGEVPDELLMPMAMVILSEIVEIADATGLDPQPEDVAASFRKMTLRYLQENGMDTSQLDQAMSQIDPAVFREEKV